MPESNTEVPAQAGCLLRIFWMLWGHAIVGLSLGVILVDQIAFPSILDGVVWLIVVLMSVARRIDITRYEGTTAVSEPATLAHWRSYTAIVVLVTGTASIVVHALGR